MRAAGRGAADLGAEASNRPEWERLHRSLINAAGFVDAQESFIVRYVQMIGPAAQCHLFPNKPCRS